MRILKLLLLSSLLFTWVTPSQAVQPSELYQAEVLVADQSKEARRTAMGDALSIVLVKVNGSSSVLEEEAIQSVIASAPRYVSQYRYRSEEIPEEERSSAENGEIAESRLFLRVSFDSTSIDDVLRRYGYSVWSAARPTTLVWLGVEEGNRRVLVGANDQGLVREVLEETSQRRGLPLQLPLLDLTDQSRVRAVDVWGGFVDNIVEASQRYESQAVLVGKLYPIADSWQASWILSYREERYEWIHRSEDVKEVIASGVTGTSDHLSQYFSQTSYLGAEQLLLHVEGVETIESYRRVSDYLQALHGVSSVTLKGVDAQNNHFMLQIEGGRETVLDAIYRGDVLARVEPPPVVIQLPDAVPVTTDKVAADELPQSDTDESVESGLNVEKMEEPTSAEEELVEPVGTVSVQELYFRLLP